MTIISLNVIIKVLFTMTGYAILLQTLEIRNPLEKYWSNLLQIISLPGFEVMFATLIILMLFVLVGSSHTVIL